MASTPFTEQDLEVILGELPLPSTPAVDPRAPTPAPAVKPTTPAPAVKPTTPAPAVKPPASAPAPLPATTPEERRQLLEAKLAVDFSYNGETKIARVVSVYDGDTLRLVFFNGGRLVQHTARLNGYDSPEMKPPRTRPDREKEVAAAHRARDQLMAWVAAPGQLVAIDCGSFDKYGRLLVTMWTLTAPPLSRDRNVNLAMIAAGHGVPYSGGTKARIRYDDDA